MQRGPPTTPESTSSFIGFPAPSFWFLKTNPEDLPERFSLRNLLDKLIVVRSSVGVQKSRVALKLISPWMMLWKPEHSDKFYSLDSTKKTCNFAWAPSATFTSCFLGQGEHNSYEYNVGIILLSVAVTPLVFGIRELEDAALPPDIYSFTKVVSFVMTRSVCLLSQVVFDGRKLYTKSNSTSKSGTKILNSANLFSKGTYKSLLCKHFKPARTKTALKRSHKWLWKKNKKSTKRCRKQTGWIGMEREEKSCSAAYGMKQSILWGGGW